MAEPKNVVVIGGTGGIGREIVAHYAKLGADVVLTSRDRAHAEQCAQEIGGSVRGLAVDLSKPETIAGALASIERVDGLVITAIERDQNTAKDFDHIKATELVLLKLVGYTEVVHTLLPKFPEDGGAIVLFGGLARDRPYPGSTIVSAVNGGVAGLVHTLAVEIPPVRVNAIHPGIVGDSPYWAGKAAALEAVKARTPGGRMVRVQDIVHAVVFLLENEAVNGEELRVDNGWMVM